MWAKSLQNQSGTSLWRLGLQTQALARGSRKPTRAVATGGDLTLNHPPEWSHHGERLDLKEGTYSPRRWEFQEIEIYKTVKVFQVWSRDQQTQHPLGTRWKHTSSRAICNQRNQKLSGVGLSNWHFNAPTGAFWCAIRFENHASMSSPLPSTDLLLEVRRAKPLAWLPRCSH